MRVGGWTDGDTGDNAVADVTDGGFSAFGKVKWAYNVIGAPNPRKNGFRTVTDCCAARAAGLAAGCHRCNPVVGPTANSLLADVTRT